MKLVDTSAWTHAVAMASAARAKGVSVPSADLLVAACARHYGVAIEHNDSHFDLIAAI
jgi:predicted nucleic acid-binding protein